MGSAISVSFEFGYLGDAQIIMALADLLLTDDREPTENSLRSAMTILGILVESAPWIAKQIHQMDGEEIAVVAWREIAVALEKIERKYLEARFPTV